MSRHRRYRSKIYSFNSLFYPRVHNFYINYVTILYAIHRSLCRVAYDGTIISIIHVSASYEREMVTTYSGYNCSSFVVLASAEPATVEYGASHIARQVLLEACPKQHPSTCVQSTAERCYFIAFMNTIVGDLSLYKYLPNHSNVSVTASLTANRRQKRRSILVEF